MRLAMLLMFHKILISSAIAFCLGYGVLELYRYFLPQGDESPDATVLYTGLAMLAGAVALAGYLAWVFRNPGPGTPSTSSSSPRD